MGHFTCVYLITYARLRFIYDKSRHVDRPLLHVTKIFKGNFPPAHLYSKLENISYASLVRFNSHFGFSKMIRHIETHKLKKLLNISPGL